jgi:hypothetical protein
MLDKIVNFIRHWIAPKTYSLAIVRRYIDANGSFVGELYLLGSFAGVLGYQMIGVSLDTLPFDAHEIIAFDLDTENDFLKPMSNDCVRVGAQDPQDNDSVRGHVARLARTGRLALQVQNRFVEYVMERKA